MIVSYYASPLGKIRLQVEKEHLVSLNFVDDTATMTDVVETKANSFQSAVVAQTHQELDEYFSGKRIHFQVPIALTGTSFQKQTWTHLQEIPFAQTCSYQELANAVQKPGAARAVGNANGKNPVSIIVPCHRVIRQDGNIGGFSSGIWRKEWLLAHEKNVQHQAR